MALVLGLVLLVVAFVAFSTRSLTRYEIQPAPGVEPVPYEDGEP